MHQHEDNTVTCQMCGGTFSSEQELNQHNKEEHGMDTGDTDEE